MKLPPTDAFTGTRSLTKFTSQLISDAKCVVRGEHWKLARSFLRCRDVVHHGRWKILTTAGENPEGEISCIRHLMKNAQIVAVDKSPSAVEAAANAGANVSLSCDLGAFRKATGYASQSHLSKLPLQLAELGPFDIVNLDLCCDVSHAIPLIRRYSWALAKKGVFMVTFSYGRDVAELFDQEDFGPVPAPLGGRVRAAVVASAANLQIRSVLAYMGNQMPMCSCLWGPGKKREKVSWGYDPPLVLPDSFLKVTDDDLYAAVTMFDQIDPALLYALPADRVLHFRRKLAAARAVATRRANKQHEEVLERATKAEHERDEMEDLVGQLRKNVD